MSPRKEKTLHSQERNIVSKVLTFFENEAKSLSLSILIKKAQKRIKAATSVPIRTNQRIKRESKSSPDGRLSTPKKNYSCTAERNAVLDSFDLCIIQNTVNELYVNKKV